MKNVRVRKNNWICDIFWVYYWYLMGSNEIKERSSYTSDYNSTDSEVSNNFEAIQMYIND